MPTGQQYATNVPQTTLVSGITAGATTFTVASSTNWPNTPFTAILDLGQSNQEPIDVTLVSGVNWTVTRAIDNTTAFTHAANATVTHGDIGRDFRELRSHIDASTSNDSSGEAVHGLGVGSTVVGTLETQTLQHKSLAAPVITSAAASTPASGNLALSSVNSDLTITDSTGASYLVTPPHTSAKTHGLVGWTYDPSGANQNLTVGSGQIVMGKITLLTVTTINNILYSLASSGSGMTSGQNFVGLYNSSGTRLAVSADQTTNMGSSGEHIAPVTTVTVEPGDYYVVILMNGTGIPNLHASLSTGTGLTNVNLSVGSLRASTLSGTFTSLPASITMANQGGSGYLTWFGLS